jgi:hypothetical protein
MIPYVNSEIPLKKESATKNIISSSKRLTLTYIVFCVWVALAIFSIFMDADLYSLAGSSWLTVTVGGSRPTNWAWTTSFVSGGSMTYYSAKKYTVLPASEWNNFTTRINDFRSYKGLSNYSFTTVSAGTTFTATIYNQARNAINDMSPSTTVPSAVTSQVTKVTAYHFTRLRDALNSIT